MGQKLNKPIKQERTITPDMIRDQKKMQALQQLAQRTSFAVNILCNMVRGAITNRDCTNADCKGLVDLSVEMADRLMEKLYGQTNEEKK